MALIGQLLWLLTSLIYLCYAPSLPLYSSRGALNICIWYLIRLHGYPDVMINIGNVEKLSIFCKDIDTYSKLKESISYFFRILCLQGRRSFQQALIKLSDSMSSSCFCIKIVKAEFLCLIKGFKISFSCARKYVKWA